MEPGDYPGQLPSRPNVSGCFDLMTTITTFTNPRQKRENRNFTLTLKYFLMEVIRY